MSYYPENPHNITVISLMHRKMFKIEGMDQILWDSKENIW